MPSPDDTSTLGGEVAPSRAVIEAVARQEGVDVTEIEPPEYEPLYTVIDPEALDELFQTPLQQPATARITFEYEGYEIVVHSDGGVEIFDPTDDSATRPIEE